MKRNWLIIPDYEQREESAKLALEYHAGFEYNDFFWPGVYENDAEIKRSNPPIRKMKIKVNNIKLIISLRA